MCTCDTTLSRREWLRVMMRRRMTHTAHCPFTVCGIIELSRYATCTVCIASRMSSHLFSWHSFLIGQSLERMRAHVCPCMFRVSGFPFLLVSLCGLDSSGPIDRELGFHCAKRIEVRQTCRHSGVQNQTKSLEPAPGPA